MLSVSHSYLRVYRNPHHRAVAQYDYMAAALLLSIRTRPSRCYAQRRCSVLSSLDLSAAVTLVLAFQDILPYILFLSLQPVHLVSFAGFGLFSLLKMVQCPRARFTTTSVSYQHSLLRGSYPLPSQAQQL